MASKKNKGTPKHMPRRGEQWEDSAADPVPVFTLGAYYSRGNNDGLRGYTCVKRWEDKQGNPKEETVDVPLLKFAEPGMKLVDDTNAIEDEAPPPKPAVMVKSIKGGIAFFCPGQECGDKHEVGIDACSFEALTEQLEKAHRKFVERHGPHMLAGTLFAERE